MGCRLWGCTELDHEADSITIPDTKAVHKDYTYGMETVRDFIFGGSKITADGDCSHEINTLAPWKKSYDQPGQLFIIFSFF